MVCVLTGAQHASSAEYAIASYKYDEIDVMAVSVSPDRLKESEKISEVSALLKNTLRQALEQLRADMVHINGIKASMIAVCNEMNIPYVVTAHHPGFACPVGTLLRPDDSLCPYAAGVNRCVPCSCLRKRSGLVGRMLACIPQVIYRPVGKILDEFKNITYLGRGIHYPWLVEKRMEGQRILLHESKQIIAPSKAMRELLIRNGVDEGKIILLPHGIKPLQKLPFEKKDGRKIRLGYLGSIGYAKGFHVLVDALKEINSEKCELHVFGDAQSKWDKIYSDVCLNQYNGKTQIIFHGRIDQSQLPSAFKQLDILVVPSIFLEVFGLVILESFSAGRPVIVANSGGPAELVRDGIDGFVVARNDSRALAAAIKKVTDNPEMIQKMACYIGPVKSMGEYAADIEQVYIDIIEGQNSSRGE